MRKPAKDPATAPGTAPKLVAGFTKAPESDKGEALARLVIHPAANAAVVMQKFCSPFGEQDLSSLVTALNEATGQIEAGNLIPVEAMLFNQAHALQAVFMNLARRAAANMGEHMSATESYMRLALKAQSQCRATLETLAAIKNPPTIFARQANINNGGQQQVVNGAQAQGGGSPAPAPARETQPEQSKLLEASHGERLDFGTQGTAGGTHQELAPVGAVNRADKRNR